MREQKLASICIPSYNRPDELYHLLKSIDCKEDLIEIVICEDMSPKRELIRKVVGQFERETKYLVKYQENESNYGYDKNLRQCIAAASGLWVIFMGDDDCFVPGQLDSYLSFLNKIEKTDVGYVLRSYRALHENGSIEEFKYYETTRFFPAGYMTYIELFRKSVFISGFTCKRHLAIETMTDQFDGTLLYQLYILAEICMHHEAAYYGVPFTQMSDGGIPMFGSSATEKSLYTPGEVTLDNSVNFMKNYFVITEYIDKKYDIESTKAVKRDISKYSYPVLSIQRKKGRRVFRIYHHRLKKLGIACTPYYYIYYVGLFLLGVRFCDAGIRKIKTTLGRTPKL